MHLTLNQIKAFERIARLGSFSAAALELNLTQPSVSQRISELESALATSLFNRRGPRIELTAEGRALLEYADRVLNKTAEIVDRFRTRDPLRGMLRIGLSDSFALFCLPDLLRRLEQRYPAVKASVFVGDTGAVSQRLNSRELDIAIVSEVAELGHHVRQAQIGHGRLGWFSHPQFKVPRRRLSPADLGQYHLFVGPPSSQQYRTVSEWFSRAGVTPNRISTCNSIAVTIETVRAGVALAAIPDRIMRSDLESGRVKLLSVTPAMPAHAVSIGYQLSEFGPGLGVVVELTRELIAEYQVLE